VETRVQRKRGRRIQEILAVAAELFGERGYAAVSLDDVAERLDVTKGSLYYYFASKDELVSAAIETLGRAWTGRLAALPTDGPPAQRLRALVREHVTVAVREHPTTLRLFLVPDDWPPPQRAAIKELRRWHDRLFRDVIEEGAQRRLRRGGPRHHPALPARGRDAGARVVRRPARRRVRPGPRPARRHRAHARRGRA